MSTETQLQQLESAIRKRAQTLADNQLAAAQQKHDQILADATKRLNKREERETEIAKAASEQAYRRRVQASEIKMQAELDQLRWTLLQSVMSLLHEHLKQLTQQEETYLNLLKQYLKSAVFMFEDQELVVEVNADDHALLAPQWEEFIKECVPEKQCTLSTSTQPFTGGLLVRNKADRIRIDNTFEGLIARLESDIYQVITTQLFASATPTRNL
ncbi:MAG: V-type ATP synthase subunit E [Candidatus Parabeggiatoa sp. nov. 3]|jgi:V/A-type H+-transporting ATPase subunit E|nr:MAG: V-type ATP synthase subunit E [Gammaproteobacteria bacterium]RKZ67484.1 MAG: V-type ATP synthase subunit E [Gammaproteobacteria bacterium]RKZ88789.1 MAG: V-type ATP synthase subunit E [Gammaproteobacteria bacterium]